MTQKTLPPLTFASPPVPLRPEAEDAIAATLTLMTAHAFEDDVDGRRPAQVAARLRELSQSPGLSADFRRLCGRLHDLWARGQDSRSSSDPDDD